MADTEISVLLKLIDEISQPIDQVVNKVDQIGNAASKAANAFAPASAAAAATGVAALKMATDFDSASNGIKRTADLSTSELSKIKQEALTVAPALGVIPEKYIEIASSMAQLGTAKGDLSEMTRQVIELGQATDQPVAKWEEMGKALSATQAVFKMTTQETQAFVASVNYVDDKIGSTASQILDFTNRVGSMASTVKMSANEVAVFAGVFGKLGLPADRAATAFNSMLGTLSNIKGTSKDAQKSFEALGISADDMAKRINENPSKAIQYFLEQVNNSKLPMNELVGAMQKAFGKEAADEILTLAKGADTLKQGLDAVGNSTQRITELQNANKEALATTDGQLKIFAASMQAISVNIGSAMLPALNSLLQALIPLAQGFNSLMTANPILAQIVAGFIAVVAAVTPLLALLGSVASGVSAVAAAIPAIGTAITAVGATASAVVAAIAASPALLIAAITAAVAAILVLVTQHWEQIKQLCMSGMDAIKNLIIGALEPIKNAFPQTFEAIKTAITAFFEVLKTIMKAGFDAAKAIIESGGNFWVTIITKIVEAIIELFKKLVIEAGKAGAGMMKEMASGINQNAGLVQQAVANATRSANQYLPHSPAKKGALRNLDDVGYNFMNTIAKGIRGYDISPVMNSATSQMGVTGDSGVNAASNGSNGRQIVINYAPVLQVRDDADLMKQLKSNQREVVRLLGDANQSLTRRFY